VLVLSVQNRVHVRDLGAATSMVNYTRSIGGVFGVALCGTLFNLGLSNRLAGLEVPVGEGASISKEAFEALDPATHAQAIQALTDSLTTVFRAIVPLLLFGVVLCLFLEEVPLRDRVAPLTDDGEAGEEPGTDPVSVGVPSDADVSPDGRARGRRPLLAQPPPIQSVVEPSTAIETTSRRGVGAARPDA